MTSRPTPSPRLVALLAAKRAFRQGARLKDLQAAIDAQGLQIDLAQELYPDLRRDLDTPPAW